MHKTTHQLARELLAGPDIDIYHHNPENDEELNADTLAERGLSDPTIEIVDLEKDLSPEQFAEAKEQECALKYAVIYGALYEHV